MSKRIVCLLLCLSLVWGVRTQATDLSANSTEAAVPSVPEVALVAEPLALTEPVDAVAEPEPLPVVPGLTIDGQPVFGEMELRLIQQVTYISVRGLTLALYPDATINWDGAQAAVWTPNLYLTAMPGARYIVANGRYLYVPEGVKVENGAVLVPIRTLAKALGAGVIWTAESGTNVVRGTSPIEPAETFYGEEDLYYLSRIINCESGNQPLEGKIAVGNVILNRVKDARFPGTIKGVILDNRGGVYQFTPANSPSLNRAPNPESIIAAKLALDGAIVLPTALYFNAVRTSSWASRNRTYVATIGGHNFYQ